MKRLSICVGMFAVALAGGSLLKRVAPARETREPIPVCGIKFRSDSTGFSRIDNRRAESGTVAAAFFEVAKDIKAHISAALARMTVCQKFNNEPHPLMKIQIHWKVQASSSATVAYGFFLGDVVGGPRASLVRCFEQSFEGVKLPIRAQHMIRNFDGNSPVYAEYEM